MERGITGTYAKSAVTGEEVRAFVPLPLPPRPPLALTEADQQLLERATLAVGRLDGISAILPDVSLFLYMYVRKEAVLSSQIEGTQSSLSDLLLFEVDELPGVPLDDVQEVSNYVAALNYGLKRFKDGMPLSLRLMREIHGVLLAKGRGSSKTPGEFRRSQNWLGGSRPGNAHFVPPPPERVVECMGALEKFIHNDPVRTPALIKAALTHVQFETIHPFLDGNGRLGRLLITFLLCTENVLAQPLLYLSLFFKTHRNDYYALLNRVREKGDWEAWVRFFLEGVRVTSDQAVQTAKQVVRLFEKNQERIKALGRKGDAALRVHHELQRHPIASITKLGTLAGVSFPTAVKAVKTLANLDIVREITGKKRNQIFAYDQYVKLLSEGTESAP